MRKLFIGLVLVALVVGLAWTWPFEEETAPTVSPQVIEPSYEVSLLAVGDLMLARKVNG